jgi:RNA polymerase subunit RPABC4/transcription elongation factor Spt4
MTFDPSFLSNFMLILTAWGGAFLAALWLSLIVWTYRDIRQRARDPLGRILAVLVVAVLFLPGIVIYLILRPLKTLEDEYQHTLEEEALLQSIEDTPLCPGCGRHTKPDWKVCPNCHTRLKKTCHHCKKLMELPWNLCPFCSTPTPGQRRENLTLGDALESLVGLPDDDSEEPGFFSESDESTMSEEFEIDPDPVDIDEDLSNEEK